MRRDWVLLPLLGLASIAITGVAAELIARAQFSESAERLASCLVLNDPDHGVRGIPNSTCHEKAPESELVEYRLDSAGFRSGFVSRARTPGTHRIVLVGSSIAMGERVSFNQTLAALLPQDLTKRANHPIELYNEGMAYGFARNAALRFDDAFAAEPDIILWILTPLDVQLANVADVTNAFGAAAPATRALDQWKKRLLTRLRTEGGDIVTGYALRHWIYAHEPQDRYVRSFLSSGGEAETGFLKASISPSWETHLQEFAPFAAQIESRARQAGIPLIATFLPNHPQAAMIASGSWPAGFDPYLLGARLRSIIEANGGIYVDVLPEFRGLQNVGQMYFPMDGHPTFTGNAIIAGLLANRLEPVLRPTLAATAAATVAP